MVSAKTACRDMAEEVVPFVLNHPVRHMRGKPSRSNGVDLDIMPRPLDGEVARKGDHATFAGMVGNGLHRLRRRAAETGDRSHIDDLAALLLEHDAPRRLRAEERSSQIGFDDLVPFSQSHCLSWGAPGDAGIVNEDIEAAKVGNGCFNHFLNVGLVLYVAADCKRANAQLFHVMGCFFAALFFARAEDEVSAHLGQRLSHLPAQANGAAGDNGDAASEIKELLRGFGGFFGKSHSQSYLPQGLKPRILFALPQADRKSTRLNS